MKLNQRPVFQRLIRQKNMLGIMSTFIDFGLLYGVLCLHHQPHLESAWGMEFTWALWAGEGWWKLLLLIIFIVYFSLSVRERFDRQDDVIQLYPIPDSPKEQSSTEKKKKTFQHNDISPVLSHQEIVETTLTLAKEMKVKVSGIYIGKNAIPNASTTFVIDLGNIIFLRSNILEIMDRESVEAVIAHELGHIKEQDVLYQLGNQLPLKLLALWLSLLAIQSVGLILLSTSLTMFFCRTLLTCSICLAILALVIFSRAHSSKYSQMKEKIADAYATEYTSIEGMMNGLLRLNDRSHILARLITHIKAHEEVSPTVLKEALLHFPRGTKDIDLIREKASQYLIEAELSLLATKLSSPLPAQIRQKIAAEILSYSHEKTASSLSITNDDESKVDQNTAHHNEDSSILSVANDDESKVDQDTSEKNTLEAQSKDLTINLVGKKKDIPPFVWQQFDWNQDGTLQLNEFKGLIQALKKSPHALTSDETHPGTHPPVRERLLFIAELYEDEFKQI